MGREHAMVADQVNARRGNEGGELGQELQRREHDGVDAIGARTLETIEQAVVGQLDQTRQRQKL